MVFINIKYIRSGDSLCGDDFKSPDKSIDINLDSVISLSEVKSFDLPFSGKISGKYCTLKLKNNDSYSIRDSNYLPIKDIINKYTIS